MRMLAYGYSLADAEYYAPLDEVATTALVFRPTTVTPGWTGTEAGVWARWSRPDTPFADQGWKIHVSARLERAPFVLDAVAEVCCGMNVAFKHLRNELFFLLQHHKHAPRAQAGKFCAIYPADERTARRLMDRLSEVLAGEDGPYILSDRRYRDSRLVHYRYGAFRPWARHRPDGSVQWLVRNGFGAEAVDERRPSFSLPAGVTDPFAAPVSAPGEAVVLRGYRFTEAIQPSNAGGTYRALDVTGGRAVFVKEARAHNGLFWDRTDAQDRLRREFETLGKLHALAPGAGPEPIDYFREWEHEFLVTEFVAGVPVNRWAALNAPVLLAGRNPEHYRAYYAECARILASLDEVLERIHGAGYRFGDLNPNNVMVDARGKVRLVDFEAASRLEEPARAMGADGYMAPPGLSLPGPHSGDDYGASAIALGLLFPLHQVLAHSPSNLRLLRRDLERVAPVPEELWRRATRYHQRSEMPWPQAVPTPEALDEDPLGGLDRLADGIERGLLAQADPGHPTRLFPTGPRGLTGDPAGLAHGSAGVVHALRTAGHPVPADIIARFREDARNAAGTAPPGLHFGTAGIAWVLADLGFAEEALDLMGWTSAAIGPAGPSLGGGSAGIGLTHLRLHHLTGDPAQLDRAARLGEQALERDDHDGGGLLAGPSGVALFLLRLAGATGEDRFRRAGRVLLQQELDRGIDLPDGALSFADDAEHRRALPYLSGGTAGILLVATRYQATDPDDRLAAVLPRLLADVTKHCTSYPGLYLGLAGLAFALADHAAWAGGPQHQQAAVQVATGLAKYAVPQGTGLRFLGEGALRFSSELWSGGAGVLLALNRVRHGPAAHFFTLDDPRPGAGSPEQSARPGQASLRSTGGGDHQ